MDHGDSDGTARRTEFRRRELFRRALLGGAGLAAAGWAAPLGVPGHLQLVRELFAAPAPAGSGGTLIVSLPRDADLLDPQRTTLGTSGFLCNLIYDPLVVKDANTGKYHPWLAESWNKSNDGRIWSFNLRRGVKFHDGTPLTADAVVKTVERLLNTDTRSPFGAFMGKPRVIRTGAMIVQFIYDTYLSAFEDLMVWSPDKLGILSPTAIAKNGLDYGRRPVGTGPFMFKEWVESDHITLVRNPEYAMPKEPFYGAGGPAKVETITFRILPDAQIRLQAQLSGQTHIMLHDIPPRDVVTLRANAEQRIDSFTAPTIFYVGMNTERPPTNEAAVRRAFSMIVDRDAIVSRILLGQGFAAYGYIGPALKGLGYASDDLRDRLRLGYNLTRARETLDAAGWRAGQGGIRAKEGRPLSIELWVQNLSPKREIAEAIQSMASQIGMEIKLTAMESSAFWNTLREGRMNAWFGDGQMRDPDLLSFHFDSSRIPATNRYRYNNPAVDNLLREGRSIPDGAKRNEIYVQAQSILMGEGVGVPVFYPVLTNVYHARVDNFKVHKGHDEYPLWNEVTVRGR